MVDYDLDVLGNGLIELTKVEVNDGEVVARRELTTNTNVNIERVVEVINFNSKGE